MVRESLSFLEWKTGIFLWSICITGFWAAAATEAMAPAPPEVPGIGLGALVEIGLDMMNALIGSGKTAMVFLRLLFRE